ncbi:MAG: hypothetical protein M3Q23_13140 [Actinomycetota bacterium]|nr:hypothetical protein [Actinomycetota bacterium]
MLLGYRLTQEQARAIHEEGTVSLGRWGTIDVEISGPTCEVCEADYDEAAYSCPGDPAG